jgi:hypothetical protein
MDTTVVLANVAHPTDSGLLATGMARLTKTLAAIRAASLARRTRFRDRTRFGAPSGSSDRRLVTQAER